MIRFTCPKCEKGLRAPEERAGTAFQCPVCGHRSNIPHLKAEPPSLEPEADDAAGKVSTCRRVKEEPAKGGDPRGNPNATEQKPRRLKRRKRKDQDGGGEFSIVDSIPLDYSLQITLGAGLGLLLQIIGVVVSRRAGVPLSGIGLILIPVGSLFWLWGCAAYAKNKGYPELLGAVGLIGCFGLLILLVLPDRSRG